MFQPIFLKYGFMGVPPIIYLLILILSLIRLKGSSRRLSILRVRLIIVNLVLVFIFFSPLHLFKVIIFKIFILTTPYFLLFWDYSQKENKDISVKDSHWFYYAISIGSIVFLYDISTVLFRIGESTTSLFYSILLILVSIFISFYLFVYKILDAVKELSVEKIRCIALTSINIITCILAIFVSIIADSNTLINGIIVILFLFIHIFISIAILYNRDDRAKIYRQLFHRRDTLCDEPLTVEYGKLKMDIDILARLIHHFEDNKPYLNREITITAIAAEICTNRTYLSKALNSRTTKNFNEFVNYYRIKEVCETYISSPTTDILDIIEMCGFSNYGSANNAFKSCTGVTPKEWIKLIKPKLDNNESINIFDYIS